VGIATAGGECVQILKGAVSVARQEAENLRNLRDQVESRPSRSVVYFARQPQQMRIPFHQSLKENSPKNIEVVGCRQN